MLDLLPPEIVTNILLFLDLISIRRCQQHLLELGNLGYLEPVVPREDLTHPERMMEFRRHKNSLLNPDHASASWISIDQGRAWSTSYGIYPGLLVCPINSGENLSAQYHRGLRCYQLASRNRGVIQESWVLDNVGFEYVSYATDIELDLLILFERIHDIGANAKLHLRSLRYGTAHPGALQKTPNYAPQTRNLSQVIINAQVDRKIIAMTIVVTSSVLQPVVWNWTSGVELTNTVLHTEKFLFASDRMFATLERTLEGPDASSPAGLIRVYLHSRSSQSSSPWHHRPVARFSFPSPSVDPFYCVWISMLCPSVTRSNPSQQLPVMVFNLVPDRLWLQLVLEIGYQSDKSTSSTVTLFIALDSMLGMVSSIPAQNHILEISWESWAKHTAWVDTSNYLRSGAGCFYGSRAVYLARATKALYCKAVVYDLSFRGIASSDTTTLKSALTSAELYMQSVFTGSRQPTIMCTFDLSEEIVLSPYGNAYPGHPIAMIDEEHVLLTYLVSKVIIHQQLDLLVLFEHVPQTHNEAGKLHLRPLHYGTEQPNRIQTFDTTKRIVHLDYLCETLTRRLLLSMLGHHSAKLVGALWQMSEPGQRRRSSNLYHPSKPFPYPSLCTAQPTSSWSSMWPKREKYFWDIITGSSPGHSKHITGLLSWRLFKERMGLQCSTRLHWMVHTDFLCDPANVREVMHVLKAMGLQMNPFTKETRLVIVLFFHLRLAFFR
ncbi:hypothetical protein BDV93DRAFT_508720 [Ceratobasidium sp. AG-I]|nr:hypothetical protein BDV93DRAFT_508720 [Ceratobasidium sp. AG-I]